MTAKQRAALQAEDVHRKREEWNPTLVDFLVNQKYQRALARRAQPQGATSTNPPQNVDPSPGSSPTGPTSHAARSDSPAPAQVLGEYVIDPKRRKPYALRRVRAIKRKRAELMEDIQDEAASRGSLDDDLSDEDFVSKLTTSYATQSRVRTLSFVDSLLDLDNPAEAEDSAPSTKPVDPSQHSSVSITVPETPPTDQAQVPVTTAQANKPTPSAGDPVPPPTPPVPPTAIVTTATTSSTIATSSSATSSASTTQAPEQRPVPSFTIPDELRRRALLRQPKGGSKAPRAATPPGTIVLDSDTDDTSVTTGTTRVLRSDLFGSPRKFKREPPQ